MKDLILRLRARPLHVRRRITLAASGALTGVVALVWLVTGIALGTFSFSTPQQSSAVASIGTAVSQSASVFAGVSPLAGTGSAAASGTSAGGLTILETKQSSTIDQVNTANQTVIPF